MKPEAAGDPRRAARGGRNRRLTLVAVVKNRFFIVRRQRAHEPTPPPHLPGGNCASVGSNSLMEVNHDMSKRSISLIFSFFFHTPTCGGQKQTINSCSAGESGGGGGCQSSWWRERGVVGHDWTHTHSLARTPALSPRRSASRQTKTTARRKTSSGYWGTISASGEQ